MRRISFEAWVARKGTSVGGGDEKLSLLSGDDREEDEVVGGKAASSTMKRLSGSSGSIFTEVGEDDGEILGW